MFPHDYNPRRSAARILTALLFADDPVEYLWNELIGEVYEPPIWTEEMIMRDAIDRYNRASEQEKLQTAMDTRQRWWIGKHGSKRAKKAGDYRVYAKPAPAGIKARNALAEGK